MFFALLLRCWFENRELHGTTSDEGQRASTPLILEEGKLVTKSLHKQKLVSKKKTKYQKWGRNQYRIAGKPPVWLLRV